MSERQRIHSFISGHRIFLILILCLFGLSLAQSRGKVRHSRKVDNKVYLLHADKLSFNQYQRNGAQVLNGHVRFLHQGALLTCDSAYFYEATNSFEAFGHVFLKQGDTLTLNSDYAYYDGNEQMAEARRNVVLKHRGSKLFTDSLNYDRLYKIGYFFEGGKLIDKGSVLTSDWGEYNTDNRKAVFNYNVRLRNKKFVLSTDTLHYDTRTSLANIVGPTKIKSGSSDIYTEKGTYNTRTERSQLFDRSVITNKGKKMVGDSVYYDSKRGISKGFRNVIYTDELNKNKFTGDYCMYNEKTGYAEAYKKAVAIDYSQKDTLYMHADTFKIHTFHINTDSVYRTVHAYHHVRAFRRDVQAVCDSMVYNSKDSVLTMYQDPILWYNGNQQLLGEKIIVYQRDSTIDWAHVVNQALSVQRLAKDTACFNQISSKEMKAFFVNGEIDSTLAIGNVLVDYYPIDDKDSSIIGLNYTETSQMKMWLKNRKMQKIWMPEATGTLYPLTQIPPGKRTLPTFAWFDNIRPVNKDDIFIWKSKGKSAELKPTTRHEAPLQHLKK